MKKPGERIVVFVTPAQKRAIAATAEALGISVSELMRRAVLAFGATGDQVKAASIVDRLNAPREPDALAQALRRAARPLRHGRKGAAADADERGARDDIAKDADARDGDPAQPSPANQPNRPPTGRATHEIAQAFARLTAEAEPADSPATDDETHAAATPSPPFSTAPLRAPRAETDGDGDETRPGPSPEDGRFA